MSVLKFVPQPYDTPDVLRYLIHGYIFPKAKLYGGLSVDPHHAAEQMLLVKELWHQTEENNCGILSSASMKKNPLTFPILNFCGREHAAFATISLRNTRSCSASMRNMAAGIFTLW